MKEKIAYVPMAVDLIHIGHINIIKKASEFGKVVVGLLTDKAIANYKRVPFLDYNQRKIIIENINGVSEVVKQEDDDYIPILRKLKPDYFVHGDDWKEGPQKEKRERVIEVIQEWGGEVIEPQYTGGISSTKIYEKMKEVGTTPQIRMKKLRRLLEAKDMVRFLEAHNGISSLIVENIKILKNNISKEFDGIWLSSLTDSTAKGKPDIELVERSDTLNHILEVTTKPIIVDGDTGGVIEHFVFMVKTLERMGVSAIIIEDKIGLKKNSLFGVEAEQQQDSIEGFSYKISQGKKSQTTKDFMIIARIESLILKQGMEDALKRAKAYIEAGADGIMIHSKEKEPNEILEFCKIYSTFENKVPLIVIPSTYSQITEKELIDANINLVIYANHLIRSAYPAMVKTAETILQNERSHEANEICMPIKDILELIPGGK
jgi:phosphoenolpyruvate phosphomutase